MPRAANRRARPHLEGYLPERAYQHSVKEHLDRIYGEVEEQWQPFVGERREIYRPVIDMAVGPFATRQKFGQRYTELMNETRPFIERLVDMHNGNVGALQEHIDFESLVEFNENARCLLCIEIEETGHRKHCLGNLVNASALGRIGILVARTSVVLGTFRKQRAYFQFLADVGKNTFRTANALILSAEQFDECLARGMGD